MASTTALFTGLTGLNAHSRKLDVIGNNIANVNTPAFKSSRMLFESMFSRDLSLGSPPGDTTGGTNPSQVGLGVSTGAIQRDFRTGAPNPTGDGRDLAIDGEGFFVVERNNQRFYTRAGGFRQDLEDNLVTPSGERLQGYAVDDQFNIIEGELTNINLPIGKRTLALATTQTSLAGNLNAAGLLPTSGGTINLMGTATAGLGLIAGATVPAGAGNSLETTSLLTEIEDPSLPGSGTPLFVAGQRIELTGAEKGGKVLESNELFITAATTVQDLMNFMSASLGIHTAAGANPDGGIPGLSLDAASGTITVTGNTGTENDLLIEAGDLRLLNTDGTVNRLPFVTEKTGAADGESVRTSMVVYDSLGTELTVDVTMTLVGKSNAGTTWRYDIESADDTDLALNIATGEIQFDTQGLLTTTDPITVTVDRDNTGALSPLQFTIAFTGDAGRTTALSDSPSELANVYRNGLPPGTLESFSVGPDGIITGGFSNGATRPLGQVVIATFANPEGMIDVGGNNWQVGPGSGPEIITDPGLLGTGVLVSGALELSNVDLGKEFTDMILTSTGYSASSRVIRTADELLQQLLVLGR